MRRALALTTLLTTALALGQGPAVASAAAEPSPGAPGIGDPYYPLDGNGGYDVLHYDLELRYDPATDLLSGTATIEAVATQALSSFNLDLQGLQVRAVTVDGADAAWSRDGGELTVTPARALAEDGSFEVVVAYDGVPVPSESAALGTSGFFATGDGALVAGQPDGADTWFPSNDHPLDAASYTIAMTAPEGLEVLSNGLLDARDTEEGWTTWRWEAPSPMASYLVTLAIGEFDVEVYRADGVQYVDAVAPELLTTPFEDYLEEGDEGAGAAPEEGAPTVGEVAWGSLERQPEVVGFLAETFGAYPFEAAGGIVDDHLLGFALETQTRPVYDPRFFSDAVSGDAVVVHELAHQWAGDDLRVESWRHIWLNEGFASYAEWLWSEREGLGTAQERFEAVASLPADDPFWTVAIGDPGPDALFDGAVYDRGAMTLHALRVEVGDEAFSALLRAWFASQAGGTVTTEEFTALAEEVSGQDLDDLFTAWLSTPEKPAGLPEVPPEG